MTYEYRLWKVAGISKKGNPVMIRVRALNHSHAWDLGSALMTVHTVVLLDEEEAA